MGTNKNFRYSIYVVLLDDYVGTLPQMRRRNPKRNLSKPCVYVGITPLCVDRRFDFRRATPQHEWRVHKFGVRLMRELYDSLHPMTCKEALQIAKELADDLRAKGFSVANGICTEAQSYKSILTQANKQHDNRSADEGLRKDDQALSRKRSNQHNVLNPETRTTKPTLRAKVKSPVTPKQ